MFLVALRRSGWWGVYVCMYVWVGYLATSTYENGCVGWIGLDWIGLEERGFSLGGGFVIEEGI